MKTLDKTKPFGEICGVVESAPRARFEQGGVLFDGEGNPLGAPAGHEPVKRRGRKPKEDADKIAADEPEQDAPTF